VRFGTFEALTNRTPILIKERDEQKDCESGQTVVHEPDQIQWGDQDAIVLGEPNLSIDRYHETFYTNIFPQAQKDTCALAAMFQSS